MPQVNTFIQKDAVIIRTDEKQNTHQNRETVWAVS